MAKPKSQTILTERLIRSLKPQAARYAVYDAEITGLSVRVTPAGKKTYSIEYAKGKRLTLGDAGTLTLHQAREMAREAVYKAKKGTDPALERKKRPGTDFVDYINACYKPYALAHLRHGEGAVRRILHDFGALFKNKPLADITLADVEKWRARRLADGVKPATVNRIISSLHAALNLAVRWGDLEKNPLTGLKQVKVDNARVRFLSPQEEASLRQALDDRQEEQREKRERFNAWRKERKMPLLPSLKGAVFTDHLKPLVLLAMNTGLRRGELLKLTWHDVDFQERLLTVQPESAKSGKRRHIPLSDESFMVLFELKQSAHGTYVFHHQGEALSGFKSSWEALLARAGIVNFRFHDLRHHFASRLVQAGADLNTVRELLGHGDLKMTLRYAHLAPHNRRRAIELLNQPRENAIGNIVNLPR